MKQCSKCKEDKQLTEYLWKNKAKTILHTQCNPCRRATAKASYEKHKSKVVGDSMRRQQDRRDWFREYKSSLSCVLCGENEASCLDFHHLDPSEKDVDISTMLNHCSAERFEKELLKCVCVCSNCHRKIHAGLICLISLW